MVVVAVLFFFVSRKDKSSFEFRIIFRGEEGEGDC